MLIASIFVIIILIAGIWLIFFVVQKNMDQADDLVITFLHNNNQANEYVEIKMHDPDHILIHNKGIEIEILEYRVLNQAGILLATCKASSSTNTIADVRSDGDGSSIDKNTIHRNNYGYKISSLKQILFSVILDVDIASCWHNYTIDDSNQFQIVTSRGIVFTLMP